MSNDPVFDAFASALQQNPEQPLDALAGFDAIPDDVRRATEALLAAHLSADDVLGAPLAIDDDDVDQLNWPAEGHRIGPFRIISELDQGGMATVYLAERLEPYRETVALKIPNGRILTPELRERFHRERQTLADLRHPAIVSLLGGGELEDGVPYAVMEYVQGRAIDEFCRTHDLTLAQRITLFARVCEAVGYVHAQGIVHRDLKPANVLVQDDGSPKLLDFGIAKLFATDERDAGARTAFGVRLMTPYYASPEQRRGNTELTPASDVYSLGVMLHELVTGSRPPMTGATRAEDDREPASKTLVKQSGPPGMSGLPALPGVPHGLDAILRRMLHPTASQRYQSVDAVVDQLRAFLASPPVTAGADAGTAEAAETAGTSASGNSMFGGETLVVVSVAAVHVVLYGIAVITELAYALADHGVRALALVPVAGVAGGLLAPLPFWMVWRGVERRRSQPLLPAVLTYVALVFVVWLGLRPFMPTAALVEAEFQTYTAQAAVLKSFLHYILMLVPCVLMPFHFVLAARRDLRDGRHHAVAALLTGDARAVSPLGSLFVRLQWLVLYLVGLAIWTIAGVAFLFNNLRSGTYMNLFIALVLLRIALWMGMGVSSLLWYALRLEDLKRDAILADSATN